MALASLRSRLPYDASSRRRKNEETVNSFGERPYSAVIHREFIAVRLKIHREFIAVRLNAGWRTEEVQRRCKEESRSRSEDKLPLSVTLRLRRSVHSHQDSGKKE